MTAATIIHINQEGFEATARKLCIAAGVGGTFELVCENGNGTVFSGELQGPVADAASGDELYYGDFSAWRNEGTYRIRVGESAVSARFAIGERPYESLHKALLKSFYYQRCGVALEERWAGPWKHAACHLEHGSVYGEPGVRLPSAGGWHDAGDYGKYIVPAAKAVADLLLAYELFPQSFDDELDIPESGNGVADVLDEVRFELEWMFKLQREDGSVFHKLTTHQFPGFQCMPEHDVAELVFSPVSAAATADLAASFALASRIYGELDADFSARLLAAAERAWQWLERQDEWSGFRNPRDIGTGEYGDREVRDEMYWAAAELYRATGEGGYKRKLVELLAQGEEGQQGEQGEQDGFDLAGLGWASVAGYGTIACLMLPDELRDEAVHERLRAFWLKRAEQLVAVHDQTGYKLTLPDDQYIWGSNMLVLNNAMHLAVADRLLGMSGVREYALDNMHYLLGRNALGQCYVTGFGERLWQNPHHRPSAGDGVKEPIPGMVAGGPNVGLQDDIAKAELSGLPPARCFIDHAGSYSTGEMTVYWNSPAVFVAAYIDSNRA